MRHVHVDRNTAKINTLFEAMVVYQDNPVGVELFSYANDFFCSNKFA